MYTYVRTIIVIPFFPLDGGCKVQEISVEVPDGSVLIEKSYKFIHGIYKQEIDDENRSKWVMDDSKGKVYIWRGTNPDHTKHHNRWNINRNPWTNKDGKYGNNY